MDREQAALRGAGRIERDGDAQVIAGHGLGEQVYPFDDGGAVLEELVEAELGELCGAAQSIKVGVGEGDATGVLVHQREGRARHMALGRHRQAFGDSLGEGGLSGAEGTLETDHIARSEQAAEQAAEAVHLLGGVRPKGEAVLHRRRREGTGGTTTGKRGGHGRDIVAPPGSRFNRPLTSRCYLEPTLRPSFPSFEPLLLALRVLATALLLARARPANAELPSGSTTPGAAPGAPLQPTPRLDPPGVVSRRYQVMGTELVLTAYVTDTVQAASAFAAAHAEVARIEALMTDWPRDGVPPSDILRVNAAAGSAEPVPVSAETFEVIAKAEDMSRRSGGAFDISFAAMHGLWKFDEDLERKVPSPAEVAERRRLVNWRDVLTDPRRHTVRLRRAGMRIGLGGIAKGYAVDRASAVLRSRGLANFMVQAGGDLYVAGSKGPAHWMVGVRDPRGGAGDVIAKMPIQDHAFSTAGDYERSFVLDGRRYHHIIDPKTGYPATASREVTIFAPNAFLADALDDAVFILGPKKGLALCQQFPDTAALIVDAANHVWMSPSLAGRLERTAEPRDGL